MNYSDSIEWHDAMEWLLNNYDEFPSRVLAGDACEEISNPVFRKWRWIRALDETVVFGNCYQPGIVKSDFDEHREAVEYKMPARGEK